MPRSSGKSAILPRALIWAALFAHHCFLFLIAANEAMSKSLLASFESEIENKPLLHEDSPDVAAHGRRLFAASDQVGLGGLLGSVTLFIRSFMSPGSRQRSLLIE